MSALISQRSLLFVPRVSFSALTVKIDFGVVGCNAHKKSRNPHLGGFRHKFGQCVTLKRLRLAITGRSIMDYDLGLESDGDLVNSRSVKDQVTVSAKVHGRR